MKTALKKALAFIVRDLRIEVSYRMSFLMQAFGIFFSVVTFHFVGRLVDAGGAPALGRFGGGYFTFVLVGIALSNYLTVATRGYADRLREAQVTGTLEAMLMTPTPVSQIVAFSAIYDFIFASFRVVLYILVGAAFFGFDTSKANWGAAAAYLLLAVVTFSSLGIFSASFILVFKRGDPLAMIYGVVSYLFGGVYYPVEILPSWVQQISKLLPLTWALDGMRMSLMNGTPLAGTADRAFVLLLFSAVLWPLSIWFFSWSLQKARRDGSLGKF